MARRSRPDWTCGGLTLLQKINNNLWEMFTAPKDPAPGDVPPLEDEAGALIALEDTERTHEAAAAAPTQFHRFSDLPAELRLQIWEEATRHKRYVVVDPPCNNLLACIRLLWDFNHYGDPLFGRELQPIWRRRHPRRPCCL